MRTPKRRLLAIPVLGLALAAGAALPGCGGDREVVVTRDQFGEQWPLAINSAVVVCSDDESGALLKLGPKRYALDEESLSRGYPDAREIDGSQPGVTELRGVCQAVAARD